MCVCRGVGECCLFSTKQNNPSVDEVAALYCKVTSCYTGDAYGSVKKAMEDTIGGPKGMGHMWLITCVLL